MDVDPVYRRDAFEVIPRERFFSENSCLTLYFSEPI